MNGELEHIVAGPATLQSQSRMIAVRYTLFSI